MAVETLASKWVELRFYGDLVDFLPGRRRTVERSFDIAPAVKDVIQACGVPHPEVDLVLIGGEPVGWHRALRHGDHISVFPRFRTFDISQLSPVHVAPLEEPRFVLDGHLARLARYLRLLGIDAMLPDVTDDALLADVAMRQQRALLTRDIELLKRTIVRHGYFVRAIDPMLQCADVVHYFDLGAALRPFSRCMACNGLTDDLTADDVVGAVPAAVLARHERFRRCRNCRRVYWEGSHFARLQAVVARFTQAVGSE